MGMLLRILVLIPLGYIAACLAAGFFVLIAVIGIGADGSYLTTYPGETLLLAAALAAWAGAFACVPAALTILLAEAFGWRSVLFYVAFGGAIGIGFALAFHAPDTALPPGGGPQLYLAAGIIGGAVYWLVAGRRAGLAIAKSERRP